MPDFSILRSGIGVGMANKQPMIEFEGDLDLFGDGSIYIIEPFRTRPEARSFW